MQKGDNVLEDTLVRAKAYQQAGADGIYPILISSYDDLAVLLKEITLPVNVLLIKPLANLKKLEDMGVKRVSLGPGTLKYMLTKVREMTADLQNYNTDSFFAENFITNDDLSKLIEPGQY